MSLSTPAVPGVLCFRIVRSFRAVPGFRAVLRFSTRGAGWGRGIPSPDPCLLGRFPEAPNQHLVAGPEWPRGTRLSVGWGRDPPCPAQRVGTAKAITPPLWPV